MEEANVFEDAKIIYSEFYYHSNGYACDRDVLVGAFESWQKNPTLMPMVDAAYKAAIALKNRKIRLRDVS